MDETISSVSAFPSMVTATGIPGLQVWYTPGL